MLQIIGWILLGILLWMVLLLFVPVRTRLRYDGRLNLWCGLGPVSAHIFPFKKKKKSPAKQKRQKPKEKKREKQKKPPRPKQKLTLELATEYARLGTRALKMMRCRLVISRLICHLTIAGEDAAKTALLYGRISAAVSSVFPLLKDGFRLKKTDIAVNADFEKTKPEALVDVTVSACPFRLLTAAVVLLIQFLKIRRASQPQTQTTQQEGGNCNE